MYSSRLSVILFLILYGIFSDFFLQKNPHSTPLTTDIFYWRGIFVNLFLFFCIFHWKVTGRHNVMPGGRSFRLGTSVQIKTAVLPKRTPKFRESRGDCALRSFGSIIDLSPVTVLGNFRVTPRNHRLLIWHDGIPSDNIFERSKRDVREITKLPTDFAWTSKADRGMNRKRQRKIKEFIV